VFLLAGCSSAGSRPEVYRAAPPPASPPVGVVFVANGTGDVRTASTNLSRAAAEAAAPLQVETFVWSRGNGRYLADHTDHANHRAQGRRLADQVAAYRQACPGRRVYLVGYSSGCAVVLAAADMLPPDGADRIILLAPAVCGTYDLQPALRTARCGIDVFHSSRDRMILGLGMRIVGTAEGGCRTAAGQCGFTPVLAGPADAALYGKLRQHPWDPVLEWSGNDGGHYGSSQVGFLRAYVLPLLVGG
jgi:pimeloyl-ACP methyl ester carboxylesterase